MTEPDNRLVITGGGLAGSLAALAVARLRPEVELLLVEGGPRFGGNHTWSFFDPDVAEVDRWLVDPLITTRWDSYEVRFPRRRRILRTSYNSISSERLDRVMRERLRPEQYRLDTRIESIAPDHVRLAGGEIVTAAAVIDARGAADLSGLELGWQKFLGREYRLESAHGLDRPVVMDAKVDQADGYRFVYCLPFSETRLLVEDTYYSLSPDLDPEAIGHRLDAYIAARRWHPVEVEREETGVLPVAMGGDVETLWQDPSGIPRLGLRGGFFHPTTGYSLPDAVRLALAVASQDGLSTASLHVSLKRHAIDLWKARRFYRLLDRMLFRAALPHQRYRVLEHFYRLEEAIIERFYAGRSTPTDKVRILSGRPPVPVRSAIGALLNLGTPER